MYLDSFHGPEIRSILLKILCVVKKEMRIQQLFDVINGL